ncbi:hypothetical protein OSTOST_15386 [Ostertagia ostertagi]
MFTKESVKPVELDTAWAAPELHIKETPVTVQSDVWGLGVITFCLLAGFHPFTSEYDRPEERLNGEDEAIIFMVPRRLILKWVRETGINQSVICGISPSKDRSSHEAVSNPAYQHRFGAEVWRKIDTVTKISG